MTASSTRCCRGLELLGALFALWLAICAAGSAHAQGIDVRRASLQNAEDGYVLEADFDIVLTHTLDEALNKGVPLYFQLEFELIRPRWYWFNDKVAGSVQDYRLAFNPLTRQYRVGVGRLHQNFATLAEAINVMSHIRRREDIAAGTLRKDNTYVGAVRLRLDTSQLPKPFQVNALGSREWQLSSDWYRWTINP
ncbi:MAG TPA: DUF4390 domain-containing protein [Burkholderiales bacterium]|nr:DUF4390 domain-containing protein [Burkholderiales bacterium]